MDLISAVVIFVVGILQGFLNTVAGGGSLLALPALSLAGLDLAVANATNRVAILLQCASGAATFRKMRTLSFRQAMPLALAATVGAGAGTMLVLEIDRQVLHLVIAGLISVMALLLLARPTMWEGKRETPLPRGAVGLVFFGIGVYGGFIQAGVGFFLSWGLAGAAGIDLVTGNALKTVIVGCYTVLSLALFASQGLVDLPVGLVLAAGGAIGAVLGARFTVLKGNDWVRRVLAVVVIVSAAHMVWKEFH